MNRRFKTIGIVGGAGPAASCLLYQSIISICQQRYGCWQDSDFPELWLVNYPFEEMLSSDNAQANKVKIASQLQWCISHLYNQGVEVVGIACNTLHAFLPLCTDRGFGCVEIPVLVAEECRRLRPKRVLVLGTPTTVRSGMYETACSVVYPSNDQQNIVSGVIDRVLAGETQRDDAYLLFEIIEQVATRQAFDTVVLGCTELSVVNQQFSGVLDAGCWDMIDTVYLLAESLIQER